MIEPEPKHSPDSIIESLEEQAYGILNMVAEQDRKKYGEQLIAESMVKESETLDTYLNRLKESYSKPEQIAILTALALLTQIIDAGLNLYLHNIQGTNPDEDIQQFFPDVSNQLKPDKDTFRLNPEQVAEVIGKLNTCKYHLKIAEKAIVEREREFYTRIMLGDKLLPLLPVYSRLKAVLNTSAIFLKVRIARLRWGNDQLEKMTKEFLTHQVNSQDLGLHTSRAMEAIDNIMEYIDEEFSPFTLQADAILIGSALDDLNIWYEVQAQMIEASTRR